MNVNFPALSVISETDNSCKVTLANSTGVPFSSVILPVSVYVCEYAAFVNTAMSIANTGINTAFIIFFLLCENILPGYYESAGGESPVLLCNEGFIRNATSCVNNVYEWLITVTSEVCEMSFVLNE